MQIDLKSLLSDGLLIAAVYQTMSGNDRLLSMRKQPLGANCVTNDNKLFLCWALRGESDGFKGAMQFLT